jgi:hypothetical protein
LNLFITCLQFPKITIYNVIYVQEVKGVVLYQRGQTYFE